MVLLFKKVFVLLWKCLILRRRNWCLTISELIIPLIFIGFVYYSYKQIDGSTINLKRSYDAGKIILSIENGSVKIQEKIPIGYGEDGLSQQINNVAFTPTSNFTTTVMDKFLTKRFVENFTSEKKLEEWLNERVVLDIEDRIDGSVGIIFDNFSNNNFKYKLRTTDRDMTTNELKSDSYFFIPPNYISSDGVEGFLLVQVNLDIRLIKSNNQNDILKGAQNYILKELPTYSDVFQIMINVLYYIFLFTFSFLVVAAVRDTIQEKSSGIKEMMRIMGVPIWMIWLHWLVYIMIIQLPLTVCVTIIISVLKPKLIDANPFIVWVLFFLFSLSCTVILFTATCFFNRAIRGTILCILIWFVVHISAQSLAEQPTFFKTHEQILLSLIPLKNLCWSLHSLVSFKYNGDTWSFTQPGFTGSNISVGGAILIFILEIIAFVMILLYLDSVKPGRFGIAKPFYFICSCIWKNKFFKTGSQTASSSSTNSSSTSPSSTPTFPETFEPPPKGISVGIEIRGLRKTFGWKNKIVAVENVDLDIYKGEITVLLGHNGAGKTTTMSMISGMFSATHGKILVDGDDLNSNLSEFRNRLGLCTQHNLYFPKLTVIEHLVFFGMVKGMSFFQARQNGMDLLNMLGIGQKSKARVKKLSGGMQRKLCLAVALIGDPKVLILDEPTSGLDPENRQMIWNVILHFRGDRTVILTTHHMEEADVLGDRIAIMDKGRVVCSGTTMFLKKLYGTGYQIHVLKSQKTSPNDITSVVKGIIPNVGIKEVSTTQVDLNVKDNDVNKLPSFFTSLENNKDHLGIYGMSVTCTTLEDVFLRVAEISAEYDNESDSKEHEQTSDDVSSKSEYEKHKGIMLLCRQFEALLIKRLLLRSKNYMSLIFKMMFSTMFFVFIALVTSSKSGHKVKPPLNISLALYPDFVCHFFYESGYDETLSKISYEIIKGYNGKVVQHSVGKGEKSDDIIKNENFFEYCQHTLLALTFNRSNLTIEYQKKVNVHLPAIAANLMSNIMLRSSNAAKKGNIEVVNHPFVSINSTNANCNPVDLFLKYLWLPVVWMFFLLCSLIVIMPDFTVFFTEERIFGFKQQQIVSGVHPILYWITNFLFDFCYYMLHVFVWIAFLLILGSDLITFNSEPLGLLLLMFVLYGISGILFVYLFTFIFESTAITYSVFLLFNSIIGFIPAIILFDLNLASALVGLEKQLIDYNVHLILMNLLSLNPTFAIFMCIGKIAAKVLMKTIIKECGVDSTKFSKLDQFRKLVMKDLLRMPEDSDRFGISTDILYLGLDWILYLLIIICIEGRVVRLISGSISSYFPQRIMNPSEDDDVKAEAERVQEVHYGKSKIPPEFHLLRVEGLVKSYSYKAPRAVDQVSFLVGKGECFGLLGVNGAGKTTVFKMLVGELAPDSGDALVRDYSVVTNKYKYLSQIGYCPQFDALLDDLTGQETLKLFAKIRGIPRSDVNAEVYSWMSLLGMSEHGKKRTSTYSGGTKRKLCAAMAFIGNPEVVYLDEPTTGVDPVSRRKTWSVVQDRQKAGQAVVLTSHSMEECEALCSRLTIMVAGQMKCIGSVEYLKTKFGKGFSVLVKFVNADYGKYSAFHKEFTDAFPQSIIKDENVSTTNYQILNPKIPLSEIFSKMINLRNKYDIVEDFMVSNLTLENIFLSFARYKKDRPEERY